MILKRFYDPKLAQASYLVGCVKTGEALVIDPSRSIEQYLTAAKEEGLRITATTETHIHADFLSGCRELSAKTGASVYLSDEGGEDWKYAYTESVVLIKEGSTIRIGNVRLDVRHTPGHTPEHVVFVLTDEPAGPDPIMVFTGDFMFVGDVGRPDLLERAAGFEGTMERGARTLYQSLQKFVASLPDHVLLWPGHGAGSACGKSLGGVPCSTLGIEKATNAGLKPKSEEEFVNWILTGQPEPPNYFKEMKNRNRQGPPILGAVGELAQLSEIPGGQIVDIRPAGEVKIGYLPGSISIPMGKSFVNWAGWLVNYSEPIILIAENQGSAEEALLGLQSIGLDRVAGWCEINAADMELSSITKVSLDRLKDDITLVDLRGLSEIAEGSIPGSLKIHLGHLARRASEIPRDKPIVVHCQAGGRSPMAVTVLKKLGIEAEDMAAGYSGFQSYSGLKKLS